MSRTSKASLTGAIAIEFPAALSERIRGLAKIAQVDPRDWIIDMTITYIKEHRSGKDWVVPDYEERNGTDFDHERSHV